MGEKKTKDNYQDISVFSLPRSDRVMFTTVLHHQQHSEGLGVILKVKCFSGVFLLAVTFSSLLLPLSQRDAGIRFKTGISFFKNKNNR